jgi:sugar O-acyltransferase (sialic acid O-acetyltransferase NeuD family)
MDEIVILGAGGHGRVVLDILRVAGTHKPIGFLDANSSLFGRRVDGLEVLGDASMIETLTSKGVKGAIIAIGDNGIRRKYAEFILGLNVPLINAIHPSANIAATANLGKNLVIAAGALVCAHCQIGNSVVLNTGSIVDHESIIANSAHICPGAKLAGRVIVDSGAYVGIGATVIQNIRIGTDAIVGAGAVVIRDVPPAVTVVGVPARIVKRPQLEHPLRFPPVMAEEALQEATI